MVSSQGRASPPFMPSKYFMARRNASCTTSSASWSFLVIQRARL
jgi:hypothetical protein